MDYAATAGLKKEFSKAKLSPRLEEDEDNDNSVGVESARKGKLSSMTMKLKEQLTSKRSLNYSSFQVNKRIEEGAFGTVESPTLGAIEARKHLKGDNSMTLLTKKGISMTAAPRSSRLKQIQAKNDIEASVNYLSMILLICLIVVV